MHALSRRFVTLLDRAARLRHRYEAERTRANHDPIRLLKLRRLGLLAEARLQSLSRKLSAPQLIPAVATGNRRNVYARVNAL